MGLCPDPLLKAEPSFFQLLGMSLLTDYTRNCFRWASFQGVLWVTAGGALPEFENNPTGPSQFQNSLKGSLRPPQATAFLLSILAFSFPHMWIYWDHSATNHPYTTLWVCVQEIQSKILKFLAFSFLICNMGLIIIPIITGPRWGLCEIIYIKFFYTTPGTL